jgi:hypothetical protein
MTIDDLFIFLFFFSYLFFGWAAELLQRVRRAEEQIGAS